MIGKDHVSWSSSERHDHAQHPGFFATIGRSIAGLISLIRDGEQDLRDTYPERHAAPTGEQAATQASVTMNLSGLGNSGM